MKYYRMLVKNERTGEVKTYVCKQQGRAPSGWKCTCVLGFFETPSRNETEDDNESNHSND